MRKDTQIETPGGGPVEYMVRVYVLVPQHGRYSLKIYGISTPQHETTDSMQKGGWVQSCDKNQTPDAPKVLHWFSCKQTPCSTARLATEYSTGCLSAKPSFQRARKPFSHPFLSGVLPQNSYCNFTSSPFYKFYKNTYIILGLL